MFWPIIDIYKERQENAAESVNNEPVEVIRTVKQNWLLRPDFFIQIQKANNFDSLFYHSNFIK